MSYLEIPQLLNIATTACIGLLVGSEICLTAFTNPVLRELDEPAQLKAAHLLTARLATPVPLWNVLGLVLLIVEAVMHRNEPGFSLLVAASALWVAAAAFTLTLIQPLNSRLTRADGSTRSPASPTSPPTRSKQRSPPICCSRRTPRCSTSPFTRP